MKYIDTILKKKKRNARSARASVSYTFNVFILNYSSAALYKSGLLSWDVGLHIYDSVLEFHLSVNEESRFFTYIYSMFSISSYTDLSGFQGLNWSIFAAVPYFPLCYLSMWELCVAQQISRWLDFGMTGFVETVEMIYIFLLTVI